MLGDVNDMELINNRYRILKNLKQNRLVSSYLVSDMKRGNEELQLNIINSEFLPEVLFSYYSNEFWSLSTIESSNIIRLYDFEAVRYIDCKKVDSPQYCYINEFVETSGDLFELIQGMNENDILNLIIELCQGINYLHLKGFIYGDIDINNVYATENNVKFKDKATIEIEKYDYWTPRRNGLIFKAPEVLAEKKPSFSSDIFSLGVLLYFICRKEFDENINLETDKFGAVTIGHSDSYRRFLSNIWPVIEKMISQSSADRYENVTQVVEHINSIFNRDFRAHKLEETSKLNFRTRIVGRDYEVNTITNTYNSVVSTGLQERFVVIHGEYGVGKTRLLREIDHVLSIRRDNVYSSYSLDDSNSASRRGFYYILRRLIEESDSETLEHYEAELVKLVPEIAEKRKIEAVEALTGDKEKSRVLSALCGFINAFLKGKPAVFIIDNVHLADDFAVEILEYMYMRVKNVMVILSYCDGELNSNKKLSEFMLKLSGKRNVIDMPLRGLSDEDAITMIQDILRMSKRPKNFGERIISKAYGNPLFIEEILKKLFSEKMIYVDVHTGIWSHRMDDLSSLPIPVNMEQAVLSQINGIDELDYEILKCISIFNTGIPMDTILKFVLEDEELLIKSIKGLEAKGIICTKIDDSGFVYDFSNRILKNLVREKLDENFERQKHEQAAHLLEAQYDGKSDNKEELIYHLEKAGQNEKVIKYCLENADKMEALKNRSEAIKNLLKAVSMLSSSDSDCRRVEFLLRIGSVFEDDGNISKAIDTYKKAEELANRSYHYRCQIDSMNKLAQVYFTRNDIEKTLSYIKRTEELLYRFDSAHSYMEGYLECKNIKVRVLSLREDYSKAEEICKDCIDLCEESYHKYKGLFYKNLGNVYLYTSEIEKALRCYEEGLACFERVGYTEGIVMSINNMAVVYGDFYQDNRKTIDYLLKMKEISEKNRIINYEIMAITNLACSYQYEWKYELALQYLLEAVKKSKKVEYESNVFFCYSNLLAVYLRLNNYKEAYKYYLQVRQELEEYPEHGRDIGIYYQACAELFYTFGNMDRSEEFVSKALELYKNDESLVKWEIEILAEYIRIHKHCSEDEISCSTARILDVLSNFKSNEIKVNALYDSALLLYHKGYIEKARKLVREADLLECESQPNHIEIKRLYLTAILDGEENRLSMLNSALELCKKENKSDLQWRICSALGDYYFSKRDYFHAVNYYFDACEIVRDLAVQLPDEFRVDFVNTHGMIEPFNKLMTLRNNKDYNEILDIDKEQRGRVTSEELKALFDYESYRDILTNRHFMQSAREIYNSSMPSGVKGTRDIVKNLYSDPLKNMETIARYLASMALAAKCLIIVDGPNKSYITLASSDGSNLLPQGKYLMEKAKTTKESILVNEVFKTGSRNKGNLIPSGVKAAICVPVLMSTENRVSKDDKRRITFVSNPVKGYIYLETDKILNNFNRLSLNKCLDLSRLVGILIERYQLQITSSTDKLTGTLTRKALEDALTEHIDRADALNGTFSIIMMDMDHFKQINDRFGHQSGDEVLKQACSIVRNNIRTDDAFGRYGGEEFIIVLPDTDAKGALAVAEKLRKEVENAKILGDKTSVTVSMGVAAYPQHAQWKHELVEKADQALYASKEGGRNRCKIWTSGFSSKVKGRNKLSGIVSGNTVQDSRNVLVMVDLIELIKQDMSLDDKIFNLLGRIIEITESQHGMFFTIEQGKVKDRYARKIFEETWCDGVIYNEELVDSVITKKQGVHMIDWDESLGDSNLTGVPDWHSVAVVPLVKSGEVRGILYLSVPTKVKEFKFDEFNYISTLAELAAGIL